MEELQQQINELNEVVKLILKWIGYERTGYSYDDKSLHEAEIKILQKFIDK